MEVPRRYQGRGPDTLPARFIKGKEEAIAATRAWVAGHTEKPGLLLMGRPGAGKSVLGWWAVPQKGVGLWLTWPDLYRSVQGGYGSGDANSRLRDASKVPVLFLDDLGDPDMGLNLETKDRRDILFTVVNARLRDWLPTFITSNLSGGGLVAQFGDRIVSRLLELCHDVEMGGVDLRREMRGERR